MDLSARTKPKTHKSTWKDRVQVRNESANKKRNKKKKGRGISLILFFFPDLVSGINACSASRPRTLSWSRAIAA